MRVELELRVRHRLVFLSFLFALFVVSCVFSFVTAREVSGGSDVYPFRRVLVATCW